MRLNAARLVLIFATCSVAATTLAPRPVVAQEARLRTLLDQARDNYDNLELDAATAKINDAVANAASQGITSGQALADVYVMRGVIEFGVNGDEAAVLQNFIAAVRASRAAEVPRNYSTPELERLIAEARDSVPEEVPTPAGAIRHTPLVNVPAGTPVVFEAFVPADLAVHKMFVFFRVFGEESWKKVELQPTNAERFAVQVAAQEFGASQFDYYVLAQDRGGQAIGNSGSDAAPHNVVVLGSGGRTEPEPVVEEKLPKDSRTVMYIGLSGGTSPGILTGAANNQPTAHPNRDVSAGLAMAFGHAGLDIGATLTRDMHLGLFFRFQFAPAQNFEGLSDETTGPGNGFWDTKKSCLGLGLPGDCILGLKYKLFINDSQKVRAYATMGTGVGRVRNWLRLKENAAGSNLCNGKEILSGTTTSGQPADFCYIRDTVRTGWFHVGAGGGLAIAVSDFADLVLDSYLMILAPATSVNLDLNGGFLFRF